VGHLIIEFTDKNGGERVIDLRLEDIGYGEGIVDFVNDCMTPSGVLDLGTGEMTYDEAGHADSYIAEKKQRILTQVEYVRGRLNDFDKYAEKAHKQKQMPRAENSAYTDRIITDIEKASLKLLDICYEGDIYQSDVDLENVCNRLADLHDTINAYGGEFEYYEHDDECTKRREKQRREYIATKKTFEESVLSWKNEFDAEERDYV
jgi:formyltetrahydrofolate hydrolase